MKLVFAGTPEFAAIALRDLIAAGFEIPLVLTQPDRPAGRGMQLQASAVKQVALEHGIEVLQPLSLRMDSKDPQRASEAKAAHERLLALDYDVMVVAAYGLILPRSTLDIKPCINIHGSILPRWRGAAPIHRAIEAGDADTGVTIMQMEEGLDTGPMLLMERVAIEDGDTTGSLHDKLAALGGRMIVEALRRMAAGPGRGAAAGGRRDLCRQDQQGRSEAGFRHAGGCIGTQGARLQPLPGGAWTGGWRDGQDLACAAGGRPGCTGPGTGGGCPGHRGGLR